MTRWTLIAVGFLLAACPSLANTWKNATSGTFSDTTKWTEGAYPNGQDAVADLSLPDWQTGSTYSTITNDVSIRLGRIVFGQTVNSWAALTLKPASGAVTITLDSADGISEIVWANRQMGYGVTIETVLTGTNALHVNTVGQIVSEGLILKGQNTYSGGTVILGGPFYLGCSSTATSGPVGTGSLVLNSGTQFGGNPDYTDVVLSNSVFMSGNIGLGSGHYCDLTMAGPMTLTGNCDLTPSAPTYYKIILTGGIGEDAPGRSLAIAGKTMTDLGDYPAGADQNVYVGGTNTFTGGLTIKASRIEIASSANNSRMTGPVTVRTNAVLEVRSTNGLSRASTVFLEQSAGVYGKLDLEANNSVMKLYLDGVRQPAGTYGSTASAAQTKSDNYFEDAGVLTVLPSRGTVITFR